MINPLTSKDEKITSVLRSLASQENCDGEPYDQMHDAANHIDHLTRALGWALEYIDAIPKDISLPTMPGFDRDYVNQLSEGK
jgi:hypothetical protein